MRQSLRWTLQSTTNPDGSATLQIDATDPGTDPSGIGHIEVWVDGEPIAQFDQTCGNCTTMSRSVNLTSSQLDKVAVLTDDRRGNTEVSERGEPQSRYDHFGYADDLDDGAPEAAVAGGAEVYSFAVSWCAVEHDGPGQFDWTGVDNAMRDIQSAGMSAMPKILDSPPWANDAPGTEGDCDLERVEPVPPSDPNYAAYLAYVDSLDVEPPDLEAVPGDMETNLDDWERFIQAFVDRYTSSDPDVPHPNLIAVEAWNEPNKASFWRGGPADGQDGFMEEPQKFAQLVEAASDAVDASTEPTVKVFPGGLSPVGSPVGQYITDATDTEFAGRIRHDHIDGISIHLYARLEEYRDNKVREDINRKYETLAHALRRVGFSDLDRWITEIGFPSATTAIEDEGLTKSMTKARQRQRLLTSYVTFDKPRIKAFIPYRLHDDVPLTESEPAGEKHFFGVLTHDFGIKTPNEKPVSKSVYCELAKKESEVPEVCAPGGT